MTNYNSPLNSLKDQANRAKASSKNESLSDKMELWDNYINHNKDVNPEELIISIKQFLEDSGHLQCNEKFDKSLALMISNDAFSLEFMKSYYMQETLSLLRAKCAVAEVSRKLFENNEEIGLISLIGALTHDDFSSPEVINGLFEGLGEQTFLDIYSASMLYPCAPRQLNTIDTLLNMVGEDKLLTPYYLEILEERLRRGLVSDFLHRSIMNVSNLENRPILKRFLFERLDLIFKHSCLIPDRAIFNFATDEETLVIFDLFVEKLACGMRKDRLDFNPNVSLLDMLKQKAKVYDKYGSSICDLLADVIRQAGLSNLKPRLENLTEEGFQILMKYPGVVSKDNLKDYPLLKKIIINNDLSI